MHKLTRSFLSILLLLSMTTLYAADNAEINPDALVKKTMEEYIKKYHAQGVAVALYYNGKSYFYNFGRARPGVPITNDTEFGLASISKIFTSTLLALEVVDGRASLNTPIMHYLADKKLAARNGPINQVTLKELATHTASMPANIPQKSLSGIKEFFITWKPNAPIGTHYYYSNLAYALVGFAVEQIGHQSYQTLLQNEILKPLKMTSTGIGTPNHGPNPAALGYDPKGQVVPYWPSAPFSNPVGAIYSTSKDMMKFLEANLGVAESGASPRLMKAMRYAHEPFFTVGPTFQMGLGWSRNKLPNGQTVISKDGAFRGFVTFMTMVPEKKTGMVILVNTSTYSPARSSWAILTALTGPPVSPKHF